MPEKPSDIEKVIRLSKGSLDGILSFLITAWI